MNAIKFVGNLTFTVVLYAGCTKTVNQCNTDADCSDVVYPFCDVDGEFSSSGGVKNVCTIVPPDCPVERCGCSPGATSCQGSALAVCAQDGRSNVETTCALGCAATNDRCNSFEPTNGLATVFLAASNQPSVIFPDKIRINTDTGMVLDSTNVTVQVDSLLITQSNGPDIRVFYAGAFDISDAVVTGTKAVAFVAPGAIELHGLVDASANGSTSGPGAYETGACVGTTGDGASGGGGNGTAGGAGDKATRIDGGAPQVGFEPFGGGCRGGSGGGAGGGAIQIDSLQRIELTAGTKKGIIHVGGGGGASASLGGGSGGTIILEAPTINLFGGIAANGGGGGATSGGGADATADSVQAPGGSGQVLSYGGYGGTIGMTAGDASGNGVGASGGGAVGRALVRTADGTYSSTSNTLLSAVATTATLVAK